MPTAPPLPLAGRKSSMGKVSTSGPQAMANAGARMKRNERIELGLVSG
jgi:hypothetical protein